MRSFSPRAALLATLLTTGCEEPPPPPAPAATAPSVVTPGLLAPVDIEDPAACRPCHQLIVDEWAASMHSHSHRTKDPIFDKLLALRMEKQGKEIAKKCAKCHSPRSPGDDTTRAALLGVSCATCHNVQSVHAEGKLGRDALVFDESGTLRSGRDVKEGASPAHRTGAALAELADGKSVCLACHDALQTPGGAPSCTTGPESRTNPDAPSCVSCHMREVVGRGGSADTDEKHRSHHFAGPHRAWYQLDATMLASGITLDAHFDESALAVVLKNESVHAFPTGFPGRVAVVRVRGKDAGGEVVWESFKTDAMAEAPDSVLNKVYVDADGKPVPAAFGVKLERDTRLTPGEVRTLRYDVPASVSSAEVAVVFRLLPQKLADTLGLADAIEATPKTVVEKVVQRAAGETAPR